MVLAKGRQETMLRLSIGFCPQVRKAPFVSSCGIPVPRSERTANGVLDEGPTRTSDGGVDEGPTRTNDGVV